MSDNSKDIIDAGLEASFAVSTSEKYAEPAKESISFAHISDQITKEDTLGFKPYVEAIAGFLTSPYTKAPLTLSIEGEWGSGKSSFMAQLENDLLYLFSWDNIPGDDDWKLKKFLTQDFGIGWVKTAEIEKNNRIIKVINGDRFLSLRLNYRKTKVYLKVGDVKTEEFIAKTEKDELKVCTKNKFTVSFNAWRHDNEDSLWAAFALNFIDQLSSQQPPLKRLWGHIKLLSSRFNWNNWEVLRSLAVWFIVIGVTIAVIGFLILKGYQTPDPLYIKFIHSIYDPEQVSSAIIDYGVIALGGVITLIGSFVSVWLKIKNILGSPFDVDFSKYFNAPDYEGRVNFIENFHEDFEKIVKAYAGKDKVYVFIDDLDRCEIPKAADLMQAINLMISYDPHLIFIIGMDREKVAASIAVKHEKLLPHLFQLDSESIDYRQSLKYGYEFIEKFIQVSFSVPKPTKDDFEKLLEDISKPTGKIDIKSNKLKNIPNQFKKYLKSWNIKHQETDGNKNEIEKIGDETPEDKAYREEEEAREKEITKIEERRQTIILELDKDSKRIRDIILMVAPALDNNPRRIKQFINLFRLRTYIAVQTGLFDITEDSPAGEQLTLERLGKFVVISLKWPLLLKDLAENHSLLSHLQKGTIVGKSGKYDHWYTVDKLRDLLRAGIDDDNYTILDPEKGQKYNISWFNVEKLLRVSPEVTPSYGNMDMKFMRIPKGEFTMGSPDDEEGRFDNEGPVHKVTIPKSFDFGIYPVTQREWKTVMGSNPSRLKEDYLPVDNVSWDDVQKFIMVLNDREDTDKYRLPSEAEWEYVCRAGKLWESGRWESGIRGSKTTRYSFGNDESMLDEYAWYADNSGDKTHIVGQKMPNTWGLYDMHGNLWEWVQDKWHGDYKGAPTDGSAWEDVSGSARVIRGGSFDNNAQLCRSAHRGSFGPISHGYNVGFRILRDL